MIIIPVNLFNQQERCARVIGNDTGWGHHAFLAHTDVMYSTR